MIKKLLLTSAVALTSMLSMQAQSLNQQVSQDPLFHGRHYGSISLNRGSTTVATASCADTNLYVDTKNYYKNPSQNYLTFPSNPNLYGGDAAGYSYANTGTITVTGLGFIAKSTTTTVTVPSKAYLYNVNATGVPTTKIDSMSVGVNVAKYYYGTIGTARVITGNFAVVFRADYSATSTQTISMYMTPANTPTASTNNFGEGRGYVNAPSLGGWFTSNAVFGGTATPTADYEPVAFPIYSYNMTSNYTVTPTSPMCITNTLVCTNTSVNSVVAENYMFNLAKFCKKWGVTATGLDSVYTWNFSDGTGRFTNKNQNHNYTAAGIFNDSLIVKNYSWSTAANCIDRKVIPITVVSQPTVVLTPAASTVCTGATATITASGATTYAWQGGQSTASATYAPSSNTTYSVTGTNACGTSVKTASVAVTSVAVINAVSSSPAICAGQSSTLTAAGATTYTWNPSATLSSAFGSTVTATPTGNTTYTITGVSSCGTATTTLVQNVTPNPTVTVVSSTTAVCNGSSATLTASGATTYTWMPTGGGSAAATVNPSTSTTYTVQGTTASCSSTKTVALTVNPSPTVTAISSSSAICAGASVTLTANTNGVNTLWSNGASTAATVVTPTSTTTYSVGVANASFCTATANVMVTVNTCAGIEELSGSAISVFPNPNTGVLNISVSSALANNSTVEIYDAIGKLMISQNLSNEQNAINTSSLANGVYIYKIVNSTKSVKIGRIVKQ